MLTLQNSTLGRGSWLMLFALLFGTVSITLSPFSTTRAFAQDEEAEEGAEEGAEGEDAPKSAAEQELERRKQESFLAWTIRALSFWGPIFLLISFVMVALIMMLCLQVRRGVMLPQEFVDAFEEKLTNKDYQGAYDLAKNDESMLARILAVGLSRLNKGYQEAMTGMQEVGADEAMAIEHRMSYLAMIGTIAPMLGLMGTVQGMIVSFQVIATSTTAPKPADLADGIATALFTTLAGLIIAIPAMIFYGFLRNPVARFLMEIGVISEGLMSRFSAVGKKPGAGTAPAPAAPEK